MKINSENKRLYVKINAFMENSQISVNVHIPRVYERLFSQYEHVYKRVLRLLFEEVGYPFGKRENEMRENDMDEYSNESWQAFSCGSPESFYGGARFCVWGARTPEPLIFIDRRDSCASTFPISKSNRFFGWI